jgi:hypothetical protein
MTTDSPGQPPAIEGGRVARAGARWTREEEERLVAEVRGGTDLAEIAGLTGLPPSGELGLSLARTAGVIRVLVATLAGAVRSDSDRAVLQRRLGLPGGAPEILRQIGDDLGLSRERVRQRQERAIGQIRSAAVLPGHRSARDQARDRLTALVTGEDGTPDGGLVRAVAALGLPQADRALAAQVIARATGARLHERGGRRVRTALWRPLC